MPCANTTSGRPAPSPATSYAIRPPAASYEEQREQPAEAEAERAGDRVIPAMVVPFLG